MRLRPLVIAAFCLCILSVVAVLAGLMALQDIYHGESDLTLEWNVLRGAFVMIVVADVVAVTALWKALGASLEGAGTVR